MQKEKQGHKQQGPSSSQVMLKNCQYRNVTIDKLMLEWSAQYWELAFCFWIRHILKISCKTKWVVNLIPNDFISINIQRIEQPVKLDEMKRHESIRFYRRRPWVTNPHDVFFPIYVRSHIFKWSRCIKTVHIIKILCMRLVSDHVSGCVSWRVTVATPHVKRNVLCYSCEDTCKQMWFASSWDRALKNVDNFVIVQNTVVISLADQSFVKLIKCIRVKVVKFGLCLLFLVAFQHLNWSGCDHLIDNKLTKVPIS